MAEIKILHLNSEIYFRGGERQILYLIKWLSQWECKNYLACHPEGELMKNCPPNIAEIIPFKLKREISLKGAIEVKKLIKRYSINIVHAHSSATATPALIGGKLAGKVKIVLSRRVDFPITNNPLRRFKYEILPDAVIAISEKIRTTLIEGGISPKILTVIYSGVNAEQFKNIDCRAKTREYLGIRQDELVVGSIAHLAIHKGFPYLLSAMRIILEKIPNSRLLIVGTGEMYESLKDQADRLKLKDRAIFTGFRRDIPELLSAMDCFVLASTNEGLGTSILDAMASGLPVVATAVGGIPEIVKDGETGFLVPKENALALAEAIIKIFSSPELAKEMGNKGKRIVEEKFTDFQMASKTLNLYKKLLKIIDPI